MPCSRASSAGASSAISSLATGQVAPVLVFRLRVDPDTGTDRTLASYPPALAS